MTAIEEDFIKTTTHNYVSRKCVIDSPQNVELRGKSILKDGVQLHGNLARIRAGRYCIIGENTVLSPAPLDEKKKHVPLIMGSHVVIGQDCKIEAAAVGSNVLIGNHVELGKRCIVRDNVIIENNAHVADDTVIPPFSRVKGTPAQVTQELPEACAVLLVDQAMQQYKDFVKQEQET